MIDDIDIKILNILQHSGRTKRSQIAEEVGMTMPSVSERLNKLEERGFIEGYYTKLNKKKFGYDIVPTGVWNRENIKVLEAFQYRFRPEVHDGIVDRETWAILQALIQKYP